MRSWLYLLLSLVAAAEWAVLVQVLVADEASDNALSVSHQEPATKGEGPQLAALRQTTYAAVLTTPSLALADLPKPVKAQLQQIFSWQLDFDHGLASGDRLRVTTAPARGDVVEAVQIEHAGRFYEAFLWPSATGERYVSAAGASLQRPFLPSPLEHSRVTSAFSRRRLHPVLKRSLPHWGVDLAAAVGTPVVALGDGVVAVATYQKGSGRMISLTHGDRYRSSYKHLSAFASGLRPGQSVRQGEVIGYVGASGLATGPHLHFEFAADGQMLDWETVWIPPQQVVALPDLPRLTALVRRARAAWQTNQAALTAVPPKRKPL